MAFSCLLFVYKVPHFTPPPQIGPATSSDTAFNLPATLIPMTTVDADIAGITAFVGGTFASFSQLLIFCFINLTISPPPPGQSAIW